MGEDTVRIGSIPPEANSKGGLNEQPPVSQRTPNPRDITKEKNLSDGPVKGPKDNYLPASYKLPNGHIRTDR